MPRRFHSSQRGFRKPPNRGWAGTIPAAAFTVPAASKVLLGSFALDNDGIDETMLRVVGGVMVASDQTAADETQVGAIGMCIVTDAALAVGITALPDPVSEIEDDMWFMYLPFCRTLNVADATGTQPNFGEWFPFDQKAKRIVHTGSSIVLIGANVSATAGMNVLPILRLLTMVRGT